MLLTSINYPGSKEYSKNWKSLPVKLQALLLQYLLLFEMPRGLPLVRQHDHKIMLTDETQIVKLRRYKYSTIQKDEIEKMVLDTKEAGIIRDTTSSFASFVVLVKKKDGS